MLATKVRIDSKVSKYIERLTQGARQRRLLTEIALFIRTRIYQFTKRGRSLVTGDRLKPLSTNYVRWRRSIYKRGGKFKREKGKIKFGDFFSPARSNLTLTGQMLDALEYSIDQSSGQVTIQVKNSPRSGDDKTNAQVAEDVAAFGRPFLGLDSTGRQRIARMVINELRRGLKRR